MHEGMVRLCTMHAALCRELERVIYNRNVSSNWKGRYIDYAHVSFISSTCLRMHGHVHIGTNTSMYTHIVSWHKSYIGGDWCSYAYNT